MWFNKHSIKGKGYHTNISRRGGQSAGVVLPAFGPTILHVRQHTLGWNSNDNVARYPGLTRKPLVGSQLTTEPIAHFGISKRFKIIHPGNYHYLTGGAAALRSTGVHPIQSRALKMSQQRAGQTFVPQFQHTTFQILYLKLNHRSFFRATRFPVYRQRYF